MADKKQSAAEARLLGEIQRCNHNGREGTSPVVCFDCAVNLTLAFATQERAEQKKVDAETVRGIKQMRVHRMFRGLDSPFLDTKSEPDKDGWTNLSKQVLQILARAAAAIEKGAK